jgi:hypothetical protein
LRKRTNTSKGAGNNSSDLFPVANFRISHRWMEAVRDFRQQITPSYTILKEGSQQRKQLDHNAVRVALIDDGVNPSKLHVKGSVKGGWPPDGFAGDRKVSTYWTSSDGHGTTMANLIHYVCPFAHLYVAKLEKSPSKPYRSVAHMAAEVGFQNFSPFALDTSVANSTW